MENTPTQGRGRSKSPTQSNKLMLADVDTPAWFDELKLHRVWDIVEDEAADEVTISTSGKLIVVDVSGTGKVVREREHGMQDVVNFLQYKNLDILFPIDGPVSFYRSDKIKEVEGTVLEAPVYQTWGNLFRGYYNDEKKSQFVIGRKIINASRNVAIHESTLYFVNTKQNLVKLELEEVLTAVDKGNTSGVKITEVESDVEDFVITQDGTIFTLSENGLIKKVGTHTSNS